MFTAVWNCMGLYPLIWASILVPGGRGEGKVSLHMAQVWMSLLPLAMIAASVPQTVLVQQDAVMT